MKNICVVYGGKSAEHDISILTAIQAMKNLNKEKYNIIPLYQTKNCEFVVPDDFLNPKTYLNKNLKCNKVYFDFGNSQIIIKSFLKKHIKVDVVLNCCHGLNGEDGTISALCNLLNVPCTSSNILGSCICMDKIIMKNIFIANNIPSVKYIYCTSDDDIEKVCENASLLGFPLIVKPSNLGSSIGVSKANNIDELKQCINLALCFDSRVLIEQCLENFKEINIACIKSDADILLSDTEQPISWQDFLNFDDKYISQNGKKILNPQLSESVLNQIQNLAKKLYNIFDLSGVIRIDFMVKDENVYVNEINTIPGSLAFYLFKGKNIDFFELLDKLIYNAELKFKKTNLHKYSFESNVLANYDKNINKYKK